MDINIKDIKLVFIFQMLIYILAMLTFLNQSIFLLFLHVSKSCMKVL